MKTAGGKIDLRPVPPRRSRSQHRSRAGSATIAFVVLLLLLVLPTLAIHRLQLNSRWLGVLAAYGVIVNAVTYWIYAIDKRRAEVGEWRISEAQLHLFELLGGWPGAWLAQRRLRHKCSKASYLLVFWLIVLSHQAAAVDSFQNWRLSRAVLESIQQALKQHQG